MGNFKYKVGEVVVGAKKPFMDVEGTVVTVAEEDGVYLVDFGGMMLAVLRQEDIKPSDDRIEEIDVNVLIDVALYSENGELRLMVNGTDVASRSYNDLVGEVAKGKIADCVEEEVLPLFEECNEVDLISNISTVIELLAGLL